MKKGLFLTWESLLPVLAIVKVTFSRYQKVNEPLRTIVGSIGAKHAGSRWRKFAVTRNPLNRRLPSCKHKAVYSNGGAKAEVSLMKQK